MKKYNKATKRSAKKQIRFVDGKAQWVNADSAGESSLDIKGKSGNVQNAGNAQNSSKIKNAEDVLNINKVQNAGDARNMSKVQNAGNNAGHSVGQGADVENIAGGVADESHVRCRKWRSGKVKSIVFCAIFVLFIIITPFFFERAGVKILHGQAPSATNFLLVWHIDSFEGGSGNRANFLEKVAVQFQKQNSGCYVVVKSLSEEEAVSAIKAGDRPNLISFSHHISSEFADLLLPIDAKSNARQELLECAQKNGKTYALAWNMSGYSIIGNPQADERVSSTLDLDSVYSYDKAQYNFVAGYKNSYGQVALSKNTKSKCDLNRCDAKLLQKSTYEAYTDFVANKSAVLLGTLRDVHRVQNRVSLGNMQDCVYIPLGKFTDLVQYMGVLNEENKAMSESFIEFLTSATIQKNLVNIGLFSPNKMSLYTNSVLKKMEDALNKPIESISIFMSAEEKQTLLGSAINAMH